MPNLQTVLAAYCKYYGSNEDWEGLASDLLLTLGELIDVDTISFVLAQKLQHQLDELARLDAEDEEEEPDWLTNPCSVMARCHY